MNKGSRRRIRPAGVALLVVAVLAACSAAVGERHVAAATRPSVAAAQRPQSLPAFLGLGLSSGLGASAWMTESGTSWTYRYQYLAGGANTGQGWATWEEGGEFATRYMRESEAVGAIPVFTVYQLLQSRPAAGNDEAAKNFSNLQNKATMAAYYADFALLLDKIGAFKKPVIIHVEPDLSGFMQQRVISGKNSAAAIPAMVGSSGYAPVAGLPDTYEGFNLALLKLRDLRAPNALMATHVSAWSTRTDIGTSTSSTLDIAAIAAKTAAFLNTAGVGSNGRGISRYDLLFIDPADRDAGYYENVYGDGGAHWWDETNKKFPNFARYEAFIKGLTVGTGVKAMLWQVPIGNTIMRSENNTAEHYQDNRVQYWLGGYPKDGRLAGLAKAGVLAILFGRGAGGPTNYDDSAGDGITNPAAINGNNRMATVADDDGGYLRERAKAYYASPIAFPSSK